ncbi:DNA repair protein RecO [Candidatus Saccharibacteria bacterium]|nr:DNA repair protein RecO [Candidatus Saccharibacteria bacterium]
MNSYTTTAIVLNRTDFGEADRILTFLTHDHGKVRAIAKGVRKSKSKLAGGVELFSVSDLTLIVGRGEINTLISSRLVRHYGNIVKNIDSTSLAYELLKTINRATEDEPEPAYFKLLDQSLAALDDKDLDINLIKLWFDMQLLKLAGHIPNLHSSSAGVKLANSKTYNVDLEQMSFEPANRGPLSANHIKFMRLGFRAGRPQTIHRINNAANLAVVCAPIIQTMLRAHVRI